MLQTFKDDLKLLSRYTQLFPLCFAVFVSMLGFGLVMPLLPIYASDFGATGIQLGLLTGSFAIARTITTFLGGWSADKVGRKTPVIVGLLAYSIVMTLYGFSQDVNQLILLRSFGRAASNPSITAMFSSLIPASRRGKRMGVFNVFRNIGLVVGSTIGGFLWTYLPLNRLS